MFLFLNKTNSTHNIKKRTILFLSFLLIISIFSSLINRVYAVEVHIDNSSKYILTTASNPNQIFNQINIPIKQNDVLDLSAFFVNCKSIIKIYKAHPVKIIDSGVKKEVVGNGNVGKTLQKNNIKLNQGDLLNYKKSDFIFDNMEIIITRAKSNTIIKDKNSIIVHTTDDIVSDTIKQTVDHIEIIKTKPTNITNPSQNKIETISDLNTPNNLQLNGYVPVEYKRKITGKASAYSGFGCTSTGKKVMPGFVAVNPNQIPYGSKLWIVSDDGSYIYGYASAEDTGGFVKWTGNKATVCDLYFPTTGEANMFGRRNVTIYIL